MGISDNVAKVLKRESLSRRRLELDVFMRGCRLRGMRCSIATTMLCCYLLTIITMLANGQAYHFSQGWLPGRKRSPTAVGSDISEDSTMPRLLQAAYNRRPVKTVRDSIDVSGLHSPFHRLLRLQVCSQRKRAIKPQLQLMQNVCFGVSFRC